MMQSHGQMPSYILLFFVPEKMFKPLLFNREKLF